VLAHSVGLVFPSGDSNTRLKRQITPSIKAAEKGGVFHQGEFKRSFKRNGSKKEIRSQYEAPRGNVLHEEPAAAEREERQDGESQGLSLHGDSSPVGGLQTSMMPTTSFCKHP
jgi:hypothetical protein